MFVTGIVSGETVRGNSLYLSTLSSTLLPSQSSESVSDNQANQTISNLIEAIEFRVQYCSIASVFFTIEVMYDILDKHDIAIEKYFPQGWEAIEFCQKKLRDMLLMSRSNDDIMKFIREYYFHKTCSQMCEECKSTLTHFLTIVIID